MQSCWDFIISDPRGNYYDCEIICSTGVLITNKCFVWGQGLLCSSGAYSEDVLTVIMTDYNETEVKQIFNGFVLMNQYFERKIEQFDSNTNFNDGIEDSPTISNGTVKDQSFLCSHCGKKFHAKHNLNVHVYQSHTDRSAMHSCSICGKSFAHLFLLNKHFRRTHESNYPCNICDKLFKTNFNLNRHKTKVH